MGSLDLFLFCCTIVSCIGELPYPATSPSLWSPHKSSTKQMASSASILSYPILSYPILSYPILSYPILSYPILSYPILSYPILSYYCCFCSYLQPLLKVVGNVGIRDMCAWTWRPQLKCPAFGPVGNNNGTVPWTTGSNGHATGSTAWTTGAMGANYSFESGLEWLNNGWNNGCHR